MKTNIISLAAATLCLTAMLTACEKDPVVKKIKADPPSVESITVENSTLTYGVPIDGYIELSDVYDIKELTVAIEIDGVTAYTRTLPGEGATTYKLSLDTMEIVIPFAPNVSNTQGNMKLSATNVKLKTVEESVELSIERPVFDKLYLFIDDAEVVLTNSPDEPFVYSATVNDLPNGTTGFVYSGEGHTGLKWGFDDNVKISVLESTVAIPFVDSDSDTEVLTDIGFDVFTFKPFPLEKAMNINGAIFTPYSDNVLKASDAPLTENEEVIIELIDINEVLFDPDYFTDTGDGTLKYTGATGSVNLYFNTQLNFVFVEND